MLWVLGLAAAHVSECAQYSGSCQSCLNITAPATEGGRSNCGWCHFPIRYEGGGEGHKCADIRDLPWKCTDLYDTYKCMAGYQCDMTVGQCKISAAGEGYSKEKCEEFCKPGPAGYKCNLQTYQCEQCAPGELNCFPKDMACKECVAPPAAQYKCDKTDPQSPQCQRCQEGEQGCASQQTACADCMVPQKQFACDVKTHTCVPQEHGIIGPVCDATCGNVTPPELQDKVFRGIQAHKDFATDKEVGQGEWDFTFKAGKATIRSPAGQRVEGTVQSEGPGVIVVTTADGQLRFSVAGSSQGDETTSVVLSTAGVNDPRAVDAHTAMGLADGAGAHPAVFVLSQCVPWKAKCDFSSVAVETTLLALFGQEGTNDECNAYTSCHTCITASKADIKCGWCMGGTLNYKDIGQTEFHCGGYKQGVPSKFVCEPLFQTVDCAGWGCNWNNATCSLQDPGEWGDKTTCEETCKPTSMAKCDLVTKQCTPCKQGDTDCVQTMDQCSASCDVPRAKCNVTTKQCTPCDPLKDPTCTQTKGACDDQCKQSPDYNVCNTATGKCESCDPSEKGCTPGDRQQCDAACANQTGFVKCNWNTHTCDPTSPMDPDRKTKAECMDGCVSAFAKCNPKTNACDACDPGTDKDCLQTKAWCQAFVAAGKCKASPAHLAGVWRGNSIEKGFARGEYDVEFNADATQVTLSFFDTAQEKLWHAGVQVSSEVAQEAGVALLELTFDTVPAGSELGVAAGQKVTALMQEKDDYTGLFKILYFAIPKAGVATPASFDAAMDDSTEFVLVGCKTAGNCDFSKAAPAAELRSIFI